jgi:histo-blood group ABO system transferase
MEIHLLVIATNKYIGYLEGILDSADKFFMKNHNVKFDVFTDRLHDTRLLLQNKPYFENVNLLHVEHRPFPYSTLNRFHFFQKHQEYIKSGDYYFYVDVDCLFKQEVPDSILANKVAVQHCGFVRERGSYESNPKSTSYVAPNEGTTYFGGGFWGFSKASFWRLVYSAVDMIDTDAGNGIVPIWHDESVLNKYLLDNPPDITLSPSYHYPENNSHIMNKWTKLGVNYECILLLLDKNHKEIRE